MGEISKQRNESESMLRNDSDTGVSLGWFAIFGKLGGLF